MKYVQDNFKWSEKHSIRPYRLTQLNRENKKGHTAVLNIILYEILKNKNIYTELVINSSRKIGKLLLEFPSLSRMASLENYIKLENGETILINRSEEHTSELQSRGHLVCRLLLEKKKRQQHIKRRQPARTRRT